MSTPQTINGLMRHLRNECHIQISGSYQKQQLVSYGYYHGDSARIRGTWINPDRNTLKRT